MKTERWTSEKIRDAVHVASTPVVGRRGNEYVNIGTRMALTMTGTWAVTITPYETIVDLMSRRDEHTETRYTH